MQFKILALLAVGLSFTQAQAPPQADDLVDSIISITEKSTETRSIVQNINALNLVPSAVKTVNNFREIVSDVAVAGAAVAVPGASFTEEDQLSICTVLINFVSVHQQLLNTLIGKKGLLSVTPLSAPIAGILRVLEAGVDEFAFYLIGLIPTCADDAQEQIEALGATFKEVEAAYPLLGARR